MIIEFLSMIKFVTSMLIHPILGL